MLDILGNEWNIKPAGGQTGEAYIARSGGRKLFLKRNSSPFLAVLSVEGIVPKLLWTKRLENGDVITAQRWLNGRELHENEMKSGAVVDLLKKIHRSDALLAMLKRLGKQPVTPQAVLAELESRMRIGNMIGGQAAGEAYSFLADNVDKVESGEKVVCHCDVNHNNWLLSENGDLYLIDWDNAMIADPALDLGPLLYEYVAKSEWRSWLGRYGHELTGDFLLRMHWYATAQAAKFMIWHAGRKESRQAEKLRIRLVRLNRDAAFYLQQL
ncbi:MAG TPA: phosphotransferase family protein [Bacillales bacterium]|nr:phosphotransferase family protein [Bacillales bacterium]